MRVAIYTRVSTSDKGQTVENQLFDIRRFCSAQEHAILIEDQDVISGTKARKPGLDRILAAAERKEFDILVVWSLDRLTREGALRTLEIIQQLTKLGVGFHSLQEPHFDTCGPFKDAIIAIAATLAKMERERISERIRTSLKRKKDEGTILGRRRTIEILPILSLKKEGYGVTEICKLTGASRSRVYKILAEVA